MKMHHDNETEGWMARPIPDVLVEYAANDIRRISALYDHFISENYISKANLPVILKQSALYAGVSRQVDAPWEDTSLTRSGILPLDILTNVADAEGETQVCDKCRRAMSKGCFPIIKGRVNKGVVGRQEVERGASCRLCCFYLARIEYAVLNEKPA